MTDITEALKQLENSIQNESKKVISTGEKLFKEISKSWIASSENELMKIRNDIRDRWRLKSLGWYLLMWGGQVLILSSIVAGWNWHQVRKIKEQQNLITQNQQQIVLQEKAMKIARATKDKTGTIYIRTYPNGCVAEENGIWWAKVYPKD